MTTETAGVAEESDSRAWVIYEIHGSLTTGVSVGKPPHVPARDLTHQGAQSAPDLPADTFSLHPGKPQGDSRDKDFSAPGNHRRARQIRHDRGDKLRIPQPLGPDTSKLFPNVSVGDRLIVSHTDVEHLIYISEAGGKRQLADK